MFNWFFIVNWIIIIPALTAAIRFHFIDNVFKPLAFNLWIGLIAEILAHILRITIKNNLYVINIFMYLDFITFLWLFNNWGAFTNINIIKRIFFLGAFTLLWFWDNIYMHHIYESNFVFRIAYSLSLILITINQFNHIIIKSNHSLKFNPYLYICVGALFYYVFSVFIALFNSPLFGATAQLWNWNMVIYVIINVTANLLFAISFLWMRKKVKYT